MANPQGNLGQLTAVTLEQMSNILVDNISNNNALWFMMREKNKIAREGGGSLFREKITYAENSNVKSQGEWDLINTTPQDNITYADFAQKFITGSVSFSKFEENQNAGRERLIDLVSAEVEVLNNTLSNTMGVHTYSNGAVALDPAGLQLLVADNPAVGTVGGINRANYAVWRNQTQSFAADGLAASATTILGQMNKLYRKCQVQGANIVPDLITMDDNYMGFFEDSQQTIQRHASSKMAEAGFDVLRYKNANVIYDPNCPANHAYFLNTDYISFKHLGTKLFNYDQEREVVNQLARVIPVYCQGNFAISNCRTQGVLIA